MKCDIVIFQYNDPFIPINENKPYKFKISILKQDGKTFDLFFEKKEISLKTLKMFRELMESYYDLNQLVFKNVLGFYLKHSFVELHLKKLTTDEISRRANEEAQRALDLSYLSD